jgi:hypothetical protein
MTSVSAGRLIALRVVYLLNFVGLGALAWPAVLRPDEPLGLVEGAAFSFWAAFSLLTALGLRYPLRMLPLLFIQLAYKIVWFAAVAYPLWGTAQWSAGSTRLAWNFAIPVIVDLLVIPWSYVRDQYIRQPAERSNEAVRLPT